eukprot:jgi/Chlat1/464/Chrsp103S01080
MTAEAAEAAGLVDAPALVSVAYQELLEEPGRLANKIAEAYGSGGFGILTVSGVPGYAQRRCELLPLAQRLAALPETSLKELEDPASTYNVGWSHGKESLANGRPDRLKGSFYANPQYDVPTTDQQLVVQYPHYCRPNIWPDKHLPQLSPALKSLGKLIVEVGLLVAKHCDDYVASQSQQASSTQRLQSVISRSRCTKARLLHYFPTAEITSSNGDDAASDMQSWCGWHMDHGSLTGLTSAMYICGDEEVTCPDPRAGLYIRTRGGSVVKGAIPSDHIAFQVGEAMQIHSGGVLRATPHCVRAARGECAHLIGRNTFAVFMQPQWDELLDVPDGMSVGDTGVGQWTPGMTFGEFARRTVAAYYK